MLMVLKEEKRRTAQHTLLELLQESQRALPGETRNPEEREGGPSPVFPFREMEGMEDSLFRDSVMTPNI